MQPEGAQSGIQEPPPTAPERRRRYRSLFWAIVLLGVGVMALLFNLDVVGPAALGMLTYVWPLILIGAAVDMIVGRRSLVIGTLVGVVTVGLIIALMLIGPAVGWTGTAELKTQQLTVPLDGATSAEVTIGTGGYSANVHALPVSEATDRPLLDGTVAYRGSFGFNSTGGAKRNVDFAAHGQEWWWQWLDSEEAGTWDIGLDPGIPVDLIVNSSSGAVDLDLSALTLNGLRAEMSSGDMDISLPSVEGTSYSAALRLSSGDLEVRAEPGVRADLTLDMSSGDVQVELGSDSDVTLAFNGSSGQFTLDLASGQALRVEVRSISSGSIVWPEGIVQVTQGKDEEGVWETPGYAAAAHKVVLIIEHMSSGNVQLNRGG